MYEFLTKLFKTVDGQPEALTSDQLIQRITEDKTISVVNLKDGGYVAKEKLDAKITELTGVKQQLTDANAEIQSYKDMDIDKIKQSAADWEQKYNTDTAALNQKLQEQEYSHQTDMFMSGYKFTSKAAEAGIRAEFKAKEFKLENGKFLGAEEYMKSLMENEDYKGAFVQEDKNQEPGAGGAGSSGAPTKPLPQFATGTNSGGASGAGAAGNNPFANFGFTSVRPRPENNQ